MDSDKVRNLRRSTTQTHYEVLRNLTFIRTSLSFLTPPYNRRKRNKSSKFQHVWKMSEISLISRKNQMANQRFNGGTVEFALRKDPSSHL